MAHPPPLLVPTHSDTLGVMGGPFPMTIEPVHRWSVHDVTWLLPDGFSKGGCPASLTNCRINFILESYFCVRRANE